MASATPRDARKKFITRHPSRCFHGLLRGLGQCANIGPIDLELTMKLGGQTFDESRVCFARATTQLMIEVANEEPPVTEVDEMMQQRDRIAAARDTDQVRLVRRKLLENLQLKAVLSCSAWPHVCKTVEALLRSAQQQSGVW